MFVVLGACVLVTGGFSDIRRGCRWEYGESVTSNERLFVFKRLGQYTSTFSKVANPPPDQQEVMNLDTVLKEYFYAKIDEKRVVGFGMELYEYKIEDDEWVELQSDWEETGFVSGTDMHRAVGYANSVIGCSINDAAYLLIEFFNNKHFPHRVSLLKLKSIESNVVDNSNGPCHTIADEKQTSDLSSKKNEKRLSKENIMLRTVRLAPLPVSTGYTGYSTITNVGSNKVMFVGNTGYNTTLDRIYQGDLKEGTNDVVWKPLEPLGKAKDNYFTFKMKANLYVAGGSIEVLHYEETDYGQQDTIMRETTLSCCDRFNLSENKWFSCQHSLPFPLQNASVVVSADETFAVITGGVEIHANVNSFYVRKRSTFDSILVFTEQEGFKLLPTCLLNKRRYHVSMLI